jgi:hypothetical protein
LVVFGNLKRMKSMNGFGLAAQLRTKVEAKSDWVASDKF